MEMWQVLLSADSVMKNPGQWSWLQNLAYLLVIGGTVLVTVLVMWVVMKLRGNRPEFQLGATKNTEIRLIFEETLSAADRAIVRDHQVRRAVEYLPKDPALRGPLEQWREKRREWAAQVAFLETLGKTPAVETLAAPETDEYLRYVHGLVLELEAAQRTLLRAVQQSLATGANRPHLGTEGTK